MKYVFIIQGEGRGHLTQAIALKRMLESEGHVVSEILVGKSPARELPDFFTQKIEDVEIHQFRSPNFLPTAKNKRSYIGRSVAYNTTHVFKYASSIRYLKKEITQSGADMVINFYELLTGLTYAIFNIPVPCVCIGHQYLFLYHGFRFPQRFNRRSLFMLKFFTRLTCIGSEKRLALSLRQMSPDERHKIIVIPPLLREEVFNLKPHNGKYVLGYLLNNGFLTDVANYHHSHPDTNLHVFWDKSDEPATKVVDKTLCLHRIDDKLFLEKMEGCTAYATTAGFESVCEALYLGKPVLMVPAHIEQDCNAYDASFMGAGIVCDTFDIGALLRWADYYHPNRQFHQWADQAKSIVLPLLNAV